MSRWFIPAMIWSALAGTSSRDRVRVYSNKPYRTTYESSTSAPYRVKSRVSVYDESVRRRDSFYKHSNESYYPTYSGSSKYDSYGGGYGVYGGGGYAGYSTSSHKSYEPVYSASAAATPSYPKPYYTSARDAYDYERSHHRHSSSGKSSKSHSKHNRKHSSEKKSHKSRKSVHWDDDTFNGRQQDWDRRYDRYGGDSSYDYRQSHDRYGRPTSGVRGTTPRATASGDAYIYTVEPTSRNGGYYQDESRRRTQKDFEYGYKFRPSRRSMY